MRVSRRRFLKSADRRRELRAADYLPSRQLPLCVRGFMDWLAREFAKHPEVSITAA